MGDGRCPLPGCKLQIQSELCRGQKRSAMPGGGGAGAHPLRCASTLGWRRRGPCFAPRPCPLCRGSRGFAGVLGRCWFRSSQPWPRGPSGGPSAATAPSSALAAGLQAGGPGGRTRSTPGYNTGGLRRAPSFLSRRKGSQPLGRAVRFVFPRSNCC